MYKKILKPLIDFLIAFIIFIIMSPIFFLLLILLSIANHGKPFFVQKRPGKNGKIFKIIKFKTMNDAKDENGELLHEEKRLTPVGTFVRKTSFDEIPQLLNVLKGDMSIVGPRPLMPEYLPFYDQEQKKRHLVRPGITGWAQVNGRNTLSWEKKFELDVWYVNNLSLLLDIKIFLLTFKKVFKSEGVNPDDMVIMTRFDDYMTEKQNKS